MPVQPTPEITAKKHWVAYIVPGILLLVGFLLLSNSGFWRILGVVICLFNLIRMFSLNSVKWVLTPSELYITSGILPWRKSQMQVPIFDVYEALVSFGMFGHFLNYGNITIRRTDGSTSHLNETLLAGAKEFSMEINTLVHEHKRGKNSAVVTELSDNDSVVDKLKNLAELRKSGELTQDEYDIMKARLIHGA